MQTVLERHKRAEQREVELYKNSRDTRPLQVLDLSKTRPLTDADRARLAELEKWQWQLNTCCNSVLCLNKAGKAERVWYIGADDGTILVPEFQEPFVLLHERDETCAPPTFYRALIEAFAKW